MSKKLVLFDIDHTLIDVGDSHKKAFLAAFEQACNISIDINHWKFHGYTDLQIIHEIMDSYKIKKKSETISKIIPIMVERFKQEDLKESRLMKGAEEIIKELSRREDIILGLVTGNIEEIAYTKLMHFKIREFFILGGFGGASAIRADLVNIALSSAEKRYGKINKRDVFIIGDTIYDIRAAKQAGVRSIGIASGTYSYEMLEKENADHLFSDLTDKRIIDVITNG